MSGRPQVHLGQPRLHLDDALMASTSTLMTVQMIPSIPSASTAVGRLVMKVTYLICGHCLHSLKLNVENESLFIFWFQISKGSAIPRKMSISSMKAHVEKIHPEVKVALSFYQGASKTSSLAGIRLAASALSIKNRETMLTDQKECSNDAPGVFN